MSRFCRSRALVADVASRVAVIDSTRGQQDPVRQKYDRGMSTTRITISVPEQVAAKAQRAVDAGQADSVSGYFAGLAEREPDWADARAVLDEMIAEAGGIGEDDRRWARSVLGLESEGPA